jgi:hypothetical protein
MKREKKFTKGLRDSRDLRRGRNVSRKRLLDSKRLRESLKSHCKRDFPTKGRRQQQVAA